MGNPLKDDSKIKKKIDPKHTIEQVRHQKQDESLEPKFVKPEFSYIDHHPTELAEFKYSSKKVQTSLELEMPTVRRFTELSQINVDKPSSKYVPARERVRLKHVEPPQIYTGFNLEKREKNITSDERPKPSITLQADRNDMPVSNQVMQRWRKEETKWKKLPNHYITIISILGNRRKTPFNILFEFNNIQISLGKQPLKQAEIMEYLVDMKKRGLIKSYGEETQSYWYRSNKTEGLI